jgi:hypothetical protein
MHNDEISFKPVAVDWLDELANPDFAKTAPYLIGRIEGSGTDQESVRSGTALLASASVPFDGAAIGVATVNLFESTGGGDDAGLVFRCTVRNDASAFQPHAVLIEDGVDLQFAGGDEATAMLSALHQATTQALRIRCAIRNTSRVGEVNAQILPTTRSGPKKH